PSPRPAALCAARGARISELPVLPSPLTSLLERRRLLGVRAVPAEVPRRRELAQPVSDHVLADEYGHVLAPVVHRDRVPDHVGIDDRRSRPGLDDLLVARLVHLLDLLSERRADERPLLG